jgi:hypothetical protein
VFFRESVTFDRRRVMGIPLAKGRVFALSDHFDAPKVAVINRSMVNRY